MTAPTEYERCSGSNHLEEFSISAIQKFFPIKEATSEGIAIKELEKITGTTVPGQSFTGKKLCSLFTVPIVLKAYSTGILFSMNWIYTVKANNTTRIIQIAIRWNSFLSMPYPCKNRL